MQVDNIREKYKVAHVVLRLLVISNILIIVLDSIYPSISNLLRSLHIYNTIGTWLITSIAVLPIYVGLEFWFVKYVPTELKAVSVDALLVILWVAIFLVGIVYSWRFRTQL